MDFNTWMQEVDDLLEKGKKNGFTIYNSKEWDSDNGDYEIGSSIEKSEMFDNACYITYTGID